MGLSNQSNDIFCLKSTVICMAIYGENIFSPYFYHWPSLRKFENLMSSQSKRVQMNIAEFIYAAEKRRI